MAILSSSPSLHLHSISPLSFPSLSPRLLRRSRSLPPPLSSSSSACTASPHRSSQPITSSTSHLDSPELSDSFEMQQQKQLLAVAMALGFMLGTAEAAMALGGPEGPLVEEFWDNMRRYGLYFLTVATGGIYSILQPVFSLLRNPLTAVLTIAVITGSFYLLYLTLNFMLGITAFDYTYAT